MARTTNSPIPRLLRRFFCFFLEWPPLFYFHHNYMSNVGEIWRRNIKWRRDVQWWINSCQQLILSHHRVYVWLSYEIFGETKWFDRIEIGWTLCSKMARSSSGIVFFTNNVDCWNILQTSWGRARATNHNDMFHCH